MSIERTERLQPIAAVQSRETAAENSLPQDKKALQGHNLSGTQVKLSSAQARFMQPSEQDIDLNRVAALKRAIHQGELTIDTGKIADALLQNIP